MAVKDWSAAKQFLLKSDLGIAMVVKYWYTIQIGVLNNELRFLVLCLKIKLEPGHILEDFYRPMCTSIGNDLSNVYFPGFIYYIYKTLLLWISTVFSGATGKKIC